MINDGRDDIVTANGTSISVLLGNGGGLFQNPLITSVTNATSLAIGDFNHDGKNDIAAVGNNTNTVVILLGHGDGTFTNKAIYDVGAQAQSVAVGDFNGDGTNDLVVAAGTNVTVLLGNGDG